MLFTTANGNLKNGSTGGRSRQQQLERILAAMDCDENELSALAATLELALTVVQDSQRSASLADLERSLLALGVLDGRTENDAG
jgi:hypothetical protein